MMFLKGVLNGSSLYPISVAQSSPSHLYTSARGKALYPHQKIAILGASKVSDLF
jgi:hypothetical protein